jgi:hypothetical protein
MTYIDFKPNTGKQHKQSLAETVALKRNEGRASKALHDMIAFNDALEENMQTMLAENAQGHPMDKELFAKMLAVKEKYLTAMHGLLHYDDQEEHLALVIYADAVQDIITHLNKQRRH